MIKFSIDEINNNRKLDEFSNKMNKKNYNIFEKIQQCKKCELCKIKTNKIKPFDKNRLEHKKYFFIAQNPSINRHNATYEIFDNVNNSNDYVFLKALEKLNISRSDCYFTNLVKCSTNNNSSPKLYIENCFKYLLEELNIVEPQKIIIIGSVARDYIKNKINFFKDCNIIFVRHPSYYLRIYNKEQTIRNIYLELKILLSK